MCVAFEQNKNKKLLTILFSYQESYSRMALSATEPLQRDSSLFEAVFDLAAIGTALIDGNGVLLRVNNAICDLFGYKKTELDGQSYLDLIHPDDLGTRHSLRRQLSHPTPDNQKIECRYLHRSGRVIWGMSHLVQVQNPQAASPCYIVQVYDVTERNTLIELLQRWHDVFQHAEFGVAVVHADSLTIELANPAFFRLYNYSREDLIGCSLSDLFAPETGKSFLNQLDIVNQTGHRSFESVHMRNDGGTFTALVDVTAIHFQNGQPQSYVIHIQDISRRKETESRLRRKNELLKEVQRIGQVGSFEYNYTSGEIYCSQQMLRLYGFPPNSPVRQLKDFRALIAPDELALLDSAFLTAIAEQQQTLTFDYPIRTGDGVEKVLLHRSEIEYCTDGQPWRLRGTVQDITERKQAEQLLIERARLKDQLEKIVATVPGVVYTFQKRPDGSTCLPFVAPGFEEIFDLPAEELTLNAELALARLHPADRSSMRASAIASAQTLTPWQHEFRVNHPSRGEIWVEGHSVPEVLADGSLLWYGFIYEITERKRTEHKLALQRFALRHVNEAAFLIDEVGAFHYVNDQACLSLGYSHTELLRLTISDIDPDWTLERVLHGWRDIKEHGAQTFESRHQTKQGHIFPVEITVAHFDYEGESYNLALARDITVRKRLEAARMESERRYREVFDNVRDSLVLVEVCDDHRFRYIEVNPAFEKVLGVPRAQLVGRYLDEVIPNQIAQGAIDRYQLCVRTETVIGEEVELELPMGCRYFYCSATPVFDDSGRIHRLVGVISDITERKLAEAVGHIREQEFRTFVENAPDIIARYDRHCQRTYLNPALEKISGMTAAELMKQTPVANPMGNGAYASLHQTLIQQVLDQGGRSEAELSWLTSDGRHLRYHVRYMPEYGRDGQVSSVWAIGRDICALKDIEQRLQESYDLLRELTARRETAREEERKRIAREIHDELGQILTVLRMDVSITRLKFGKDDDALLKQLQIIVERVDKTIQLVRDVASRLRPTALDMGITSALEWLCSEFSARTGIPCRLFTEEKEIPLDEQSAVAVFRIVQESLTNIVRYAEATQVDIMLVQDETNCCLEVRDNGKGFDPANVQKHSFGLLGMRERAVMLKGTVDFFSIPGKGTTIRAHIPLSQVAARES